MSAAPVTAAALCLGLALSAPSGSAPYVAPPGSPSPADLPAGTRVLDPAARRIADERLDVAVLMAQFYLEQARSTGDPHDLGFADAVLTRWVREPDPAPRALVLRAMVQESRHDFGAALATLDRALALHPTDPQAWLTRISILRVMGLYAEAGAACERFAQTAATSLSELCRQSLRALNGGLVPAYAALSKTPTGDMSPVEQAWRDSELGEMAVRLGRDAEAERWFLRGLQVCPEYGYLRAAYADLLLRQRRAPDVLALLRGRSAQEPLLLRIAIAQKMTGDPGLACSAATLQASFDAESRRGDAIHRREQARFLLEVRQHPQLALAAAIENWKLQREPEDVLIFVNAAASAGAPDAAKPAMDFVRAHHLSDARLRVGSFPSGHALAASR